MAKPVNAQCGPGHLGITRLSRLVLNETRELPDVAIAIARMRKSVAGARWAAYDRPYQDSA